jgi:ABC-type uncharacterized transport system auxiliary subunit
LFALTACGSVAPLPEDVFLRLAVAVPSPVGAPWTAGDIRIAPPVASGLYKERALAYTRDGGSSLQQSRYQLWIDSPEHMLQQELAAYLRGAQPGVQVVTESAAKSRLVVAGRITHFEQLARSDSLSMMAGLELTVRDLQREQTLLVKAYVATEPMEDATPTAVAQAMSRAVATICAAFVVDISSIKPLLARESAP